MAKVDLVSNTIKLEGADISTVALMAGLIAAVTPTPTNSDEPDITPEDCAKSATMLYRAVIREVFQTNVEPGQNEAIDLLVEIWSSLNEENGDVVLGRELTRRLTELLVANGRLNEDEAVAQPEEQGRSKSLGLDSHFNDTGRRR